MRILRGMLACATPCQKFKPLYLACSAPWCCRALQFTPSVVLQNRQIPCNNSTSKLRGMIMRIFGDLTTRNSPVLDPEPNSLLRQLPAPALHRRPFIRCEREVACIKTEAPKCGMPTRNPLLCDICCKHTCCKQHLDEKTSKKPTFLGNGQPYFLKRAHLDLCQVLMALFALETWRSKGTCSSEALGSSRQQRSRKETNAGCHKPALPPL